MFQFLHDENSRNFLDSLEKVNFQPGEAVFHFGDRGDCLYFVRGGSVELFVKDHTGEKIVLRVAGPGDIFGELSLLDNGPRTATAIAIESSELSVLGQQDLLQFLRKIPEAALHLLTNLGKHLRQTNQLVRERVSKNINQELEEKLTWGQKLANFIAIFSGSMPFLMINAALFALWIILNVNIIPGLKPFDPYPFGFLTMAVSLEAIFLSIFVLLAQSLQAVKDRIRGNIEYEVNLHAEMEITYLHEKIDQMNAEMLKHFHQLEK